MMQALNAGSLGRSFSLTRCNTSQEKKPRRRRTKEERKSMVESFITKYRSSHNGSFPSLNLTHKEVGGSFYTVREIMRDVIQENKVLGPGNARMKSLKFEDVLEGDKANYLSTNYGKESSISFMEHEVHTELSEREDEDSFRSLHSHQPEDCHLNDAFLLNETHHQQSSHLQQNSEVGSQSQQSLGTEELKDDAGTLLNPKKYKSLVYEDNNFESHVDSESSSIQKTEQVESPHLSFPIDSPKVIAHLQQNSEVGSQSQQSLGTEELKDDAGTLLNPKKYKSLVYEDKNFESHVDSESSSIQKTEQVESPHLSFPIDSPKVIAHLQQNSEVGNQSQQSLGTEELKDDAGTLLNPKKYKSLVYEDNNFESHVDSESSSIQPHLSFPIDSPKVIAHLQTNSEVGSQSQQSLGTEELKDDAGTLLNPKKYKSLVYEDKNFESHVDSESSSIQKTEQVESPHLSFPIDSPKVIAHLQQNSEVGSQSQQSLGTEELKDDAGTLLNPKKYKSLVYEDNNFESHVDSESSSIQPHLSFPIDSPKVIAHLQTNSEVGSQSQQSLGTEELKDDAGTLLNPKKSKSLVYEDNNFESHVDSESSSIQKTEQVESPHLSFPIDSPKVIAHLQPNSEVGSQSQQSLGTEELKDDAGTLLNPKKYKSLAYEDNNFESHVDSESSSIQKTEQVESPHLSFPIDSPKVIAHLQPNSEVGSQSQQSLGTEELKDDAGTLLNHKKYKSLVYEDKNFESHVDSESSSIQKTEQVESPHLSFPIDSPKVIALNDHNLNNDILTDATNIVEDSHADCRTSGEDVSQESKIHFAPLVFDASHELSNISDSSGEMLSSMESDSTNNHTLDSDLLERDGPTGFNEISANQNLVNEKVLSTPPNNTIFTSNKMDSGDIMFHGSIGEISHHSPISQTSGASMSNALRTEGADVKTTLPSQKLSKVEPKAEKENKHSNPHASSSHPSETIEASRTEDNNPIWGTIKRIVASCIKFFTS